MKSLLVLSLLFALAAWSAGSAGANPKIDESALTGMRKGQTTFDEIVRRFGRPNFMSKSWDGTRAAAYAYSEGWSPAALSALGAVMGGSRGDTVVLYFDDKDVLTNYRINHATAKPADAPATPAVRYVEPAPAGAAPPVAAKPAAASAARPVEATPLAPVPGAKPATAQATKPEQRNDGPPWWLPSTSTRGDRY